MHLYNLTLQGISQVTGQVVGHFSGSKHQEVLIARHDRLELLKADPTTGKLETLLVTPSVFGAIRAVVPFRLTGATKDHIIVASDSGRIVILEYDGKENVLNKVHQETYGKSGCRRVVPGQYLATDPKGRATMIGAVEKQKLVYILNRDAAANLTISSPLEAHKAHTLLFHVVGLDVGFENPIFACLELDYSEADQDPTGEALEMTEKVLTYYELDLGLNHVVRKWSDPVDPRSNLLVAVPGGADGPSGVLVCSENFITYRHHNAPEHCVPIPRRNVAGQDPDRGLLIVASALHKMKNSFFILLQSEDGDVYKVTVEHAAGEATELRIKYFDTLPVACGMSILKSGFMVVSPEAGNQALYQFIGLGTDASELELTSSDFGEGRADPNDPVYFVPRALTNLQQTDEVESMAPLIDAAVLDICNEDSPQVYALCGKGATSSFRILRHGLEVTEVGEMQLPGRPTAVWTTRLGPADDTGVYVVSFINATLVLTMSESPDEVPDSGIATTTQTLAIQQLGDEGVVQIHPQGIRHIRPDGRVNEWRPPKEKTIQAAATNPRQVLIALTGGELVYFELDALSQLAELSNRAVMASQVTSLCLGNVPAARQRFPFAVVGCADNTVRTLSLDPVSPMQPLSMQAVADIPVSLFALEMPNPDLPTQGSLFLHIGLSNGVMLRTVMDHVTGVLSDTRTRFLGSRPVKLHGVNIQGAPAVLALSSRPWITYTRQTRTRTMPLSYEPLEYASSFSTEQWPDGIVAITGDCLKLLSVEKLDSTFNQATVPLKYTPRRLAVHPESNHFVIIESENNTFSPATINNMIQNGAAPESLTLDPAVFGLPKAQPGKWASQVRVLNPFSGETTAELELEENEAAFSMAVLTFQNYPDQYFVAVGTAVDAVLSPRSCSAAYIRLYKFNEQGNGLELVHRTPVEDIPMALLGFKGRLLAGVGRLLRVYALGKFKMLRKCQCKQIPVMVVSIRSQGERIIVGDVQESVHYATYSANDNLLVVYADDSLPAWTSAVCQVDYDTTAVGDKFGNVFVARLAPEAIAEIEGDTAHSETPLKASSLIQRLPPNFKGSLNGAPHKLERLSSFHVGDTITSLHKVSLVRGGKEVLVYTTLLGSIGVLIPFHSKEDVEFFQTLEFHMREAAPPLLGRDHLAYRSHYYPVNAAVDGDLCELYHRLPLAQRQNIAGELERTPQEVAKKIDDLRTLAAF
ncbi:pre-mRNA-splicing factor rse1 [Massospora cicadina]|nr:pre-mRNA-splicing factor rse1 [Massospora cicadina]